MLQCHHLRDTFSFPLAHKPIPPDTRKEASSDSVNTIPNVKPHVHQPAPEKRALSTARHTSKHSKPPADSFPSVPKNTVTRQTTRKRSGLLTAKEESTKLLHFSYYLSAPKSNGETEAPSYKPDFIQFTMYMRKVLGLKEATFFFSLNYISRNIRILYQQEQTLV